MCQRNADLQPNIESEQEVDWTRAVQAYTNIEEIPSFISRQHASAGQRAFTTGADPRQLQGKQVQVYTIVQQNMEAEGPSPLMMIVSGTAGTGKSYLIHCLEHCGGERELECDGCASACRAAGVGWLVLDQCKSQCAL